MNEKPSITEVFEQLGGKFRGSYGHGYRAAYCLLHEDTHPSATVSEDSGYFKCWVCSICLDVYDLVQQVEGIGFREAQRRAVELAGPSSAPVRTKSGRPDKRVPQGKRDRPGWTPPWKRGKPA